MYLVSSPSFPRPEEAGFSLRPTSGVLYLKRYRFYYVFPFLSQYRFCQVSDLDGRNAYVCICVVEKNEILVILIDCLIDMFDRSNDS